MPTNDLSGQEIIDRYSGHLYMFKKSEMAEQI